MSLRYGELAANRAAPSAPNAPPSVETKTSVCEGCVATVVVPVAGAYARASSTSAAVPEALSFAPCPSPLLSRWAVITILRCEAPSHDGDQIRQLDAPAARNRRREAVFLGRSKP